MKINLKFSIWNYVLPSDWTLKIGLSTYNWKLMPEQVWTFWPVCLAKKSVHNYSTALMKEVYFNSNQDWCYLISLSNSNPKNIKWHSQNPLSGCRLKGWGNPSDFHVTKLDSSHYLPQLNQFFQFVMIRNRFKPLGSTWKIPVLRNRLIGLHALLYLDIVSWISDKTNELQREFLVV